ncbi:protein SUPPRESSOR OF PHYA-105 1 [Typha angustifolia]|uniref:protein SUPPRESSOR OF PHYA-105 1 n=1 Tax=Typha angustifolia TaxID=59011 RepID=UPI003C303C9B
MGGATEVNENIEGSTEGFRFKSKENGQPQLQSISCSALETPALVSRDADWPEHFPLLQLPETFLEMVDGRGANYSNFSHSGSQPDFTDPKSSSIPGMMVEELTLKNYRIPSLSIDGNPGSGERPFARKGLWHNFMRLAGGMRDAPPGDISRRDEASNALLPQFGAQRPFSCMTPDDSAQSAEFDNHTASNSSSRFPDRVQSTLLTSEFPEILVKSTLKGKGVAYRGAHERVFRDQAVEKPNANTEVTSTSLHRTSAKADGISLFGGGNGGVDLDTHHNEINLREHLNVRHQKISKPERLHIFKQILELVDICHSHRLFLQQLRPSYFLISPSNKVKYIGSFIPHESPDLVKQDSQYMEDHLNRKRYLDVNKYNGAISRLKRRKIGEYSDVGTWHHICSPMCDSKNVQGEESGASVSRSANSGCDLRELLRQGEPYNRTSLSHIPSVYNHSRQKPMFEMHKVEEMWYTSPEELHETVCPFASNIYSLGVLLFELFCYFESWEVHSVAMSNLHYRILPPNFLAENPKEAGFCLWLLHPEPFSRPKAREIVLCDFISEDRDLSILDQPTVSIDEEDAEADMLLHFLISLKEQKEKKIAKLVEDLGCVQTDIAKVEKRTSSGAEFNLDVRDRLANFAHISDIFPHRQVAGSEIIPRLTKASIYEERLLRNIEQLENTYFSMRSNVETSEANPAPRSDCDVLKIRDRCHQVENNADVGKESTTHLGAFFEGLCKYARYSKFEALGSLKNIEMLNSANVICSLSFDRDEEYFAAAGVSKKIKIFEFNSLLDDSVDIHYPLIEMPSRSKISCVCWNNYIKNYLASTDYEGVVQLWDASTSQGFMQFTAHRKRAWSVNFSQKDPTKLVSGSDDCSVKVWSINEKNCIDTIRCVANVCCVQFSSYSSHMLAFGSADYKIYCYDLRNTRIPWCTLGGHGKAVSYVKFLDSETIVSASTDNTLKIWDLNKTNASGLSTGACSLTLSGHTNEKNFVGLSICDGYIACGSETNEVYAFNRTFPMPICSHKFGSLDPITGQETSGSNAQFVSSVCWRDKSNMVVAANSTGSIKVLQLV